MEQNLQDTVICQFENSDTADIYTARQTPLNISLEIAPALPLRISGYVSDSFAHGTDIERVAVLVYSQVPGDMERTPTNVSEYFLSVTLEPGVPLPCNLILPLLQSPEASA